jgi:phosphoglucosamine mutase
MKNLFGTDGLRGAVGVDPITPDFFVRLGWALGAFIRERCRQEKAPMVVVGRDTRATGPVLQDALGRGLAIQGVQVLDLGVVPTPVVPFMVRRMHAEFGVSITASHNPAQDNGFKGFLSTGLKMSPEQECQLCGWLQASSSYKPSSSALLPVINYPDALQEYMAFIRRLMPLGGLKGMRIVMDAAHGAAAFTTSKLLGQWGAELVLLGHEPDGHNINAQVGSEHPQSMAEAVLAHKAQVGFAHDGDGDRLLVCNEHGQVVPGEKILGLIAVEYKRQGRLSQSRLVTTQASNAGLEASLGLLDIAVDYVNVGDRYLLAHMAERGLNLGGEASGHFVTHAEHLAGDGLVAALVLLEIMRKRLMPLSSLTECIQLYPQATDSLPVVRRLPIETDPVLVESIQVARSLLGPKGRVLVRYSGTEDKIRLLAEGPTLDQAHEALDVLRSSVYKVLCVST